MILVKLFGQVGPLRIKRQFVFFGPSSPPRFLSPTFFSRIIGCFFISRSHGLYLREVDVFLEDYDSMGKVGLVWLDCLVSLNSLYRHSSLSEVSISMIFRL